MDESIGNMIEIIVQLHIEYEEDQISYNELFLILNHQSDENLL